MEGSWSGASSSLKTITSLCAWSAYWHRRAVIFPAPYVVNSLHMLYGEIPPASHPYVLDVDISRTIETYSRNELSLNGDIRFQSQICRGCEACRVHKRGRTVRNHLLLIMINTFDMKNSRQCSLDEAVEYMIHSNNRIKRSRHLFVYTLPSTRWRKKTRKRKWFV